MSDRRRSIADRIYRLVLRLFPAEFRGDFAEQMMEDFRDQRRDAWRDAGRIGVAKLWVRTLRDLLTQAPREQTDTLAADVRFAVRMMRRYAASTIVLVVLLALGIGANVAVFTLADATIRRPLPVGEGENLVRVGDSAGGTVSYPTYEDLRDRVRTFDGVAAHQYTTVIVGTGDAARPAGGEVVSGNYFDVYRVGAALGRTLHAADDQTVGAHPVVVISTGFWRDHFGGAPDVVGRTLHLNGYPFQVVGVARDGFPGSYTAFASRFWAPIAMYKQVRPRNQELRSRGWGWLWLTGRLRTRTGLDLAREDVLRIGAELQREHPQPDGAAQYTVVRASGLPESVRQSASVALTFAAAVAVLVLLVTCANVAGVLHSRAAARVRETAVRYALGATRFRVVRQWLTEGVLLACIGAICGLFVQRGIHKGLASLLQTVAPQQLTMPSGTDGRVIAFTFLLALASGLAFAFLPAYRSASRGDAALRETATAVTPGRSASRTTRVLVVLQVSVCLCLLVTAGLLTRSLRNTRTFDVGFDSSGLLLAQVDLHRLGYDPARAAAFFERLASRVRVVPGVRAVSRAAVVPLGGDRERQGFRIAGHTGPGGQPTIMLDVNAVGADYFAALGVPILRGRDFTAADTPRSQPVVIINETMARQYWPGRSALGETIALPGGPSFEVIGVARDIKYYALDEAARSYVYVPAAQIGAAAPVVHVRVDGPAAAFLNLIRREAASIDPSVTLQNVMTFEDLRQQPLVLRRAMTVLATAFGALSLLLAVVGIYGTMTNAVAQRAREIGVRMAFGAEISDVFRLVVGAGLRPVLLGLAIGLPSAGIVTRLVRSELFGVTTGDPVTHVAAVALILVTAFGTLILPARRAARVDPVTILRHDQ